MCMNIFLVKTYDMQHVPSFTWHRYEEIIEGIENRNNSHPGYDDNLHPRPD